MITSTYIPSKEMYKATACQISLLYPMFNYVYNKSWFVRISITRKHFSVIQTIFRHIEIQDGGAVTSQTYLSKLI